MVFAHIDKDDLEVLHAGYAYHSKPFHTIERLKQYLIRIQIEGFCRASVGSEITLIEPGDMILLKPNSPYELIIDQEKQTTGEPRIMSGDYYIFAKGTWMDEWWNQTHRPHKIKAPLNEGILTLFRQLTMEQRRLLDTSQEISQYILKILCLNIDRIVSEQPSKKGNAFLAYRIKTYIEEHAIQSFKLEDVAVHFDISVSRAVHLFKEVFGQSIGQYALDVRLSMARDRMMLTNMLLEDIAESAGFANYSYFHRAFRARYNMSPREYRSTF
ncbi:AraC family transcriptional regulator [Paenibacillus sp. N1-5-1-14]|uniref:AraC family transcriptional regulator n=1 Tax=Paenibacillus radicibacter TaxID=2972488 RepID=UPI002158A870|nr:AraC family transcriptional regulator [Paenibacillus radicibacter]MCR8643161.1 AraC family transcriptional regulator [Paenibacillus radicibacter]